MARFMCVVVVVLGLIQPSFSHVDCDTKISADQSSSTSMATMGTHNRPQVVKSNKRGLVMSEFLPCEPWNSCVGRCVGPGDKQTDRLPPYTCYCDSSCSEYRDCCSDYGHVCRDYSPPTFWKNRGMVFTCIDLGWDRYGILMVHRCPVTWTGDKSIRDGCESEDYRDVRPVSDDTGVAYRNLFCSMCNGVNINNITRWRNTSWCKENGAKDPSCKFQAPAQLSSSQDDSYFPRKCFHHVGDCPQRLFETAPQTALRCYVYSGMVTVENSKGVLTKFKNAYCAICNGVPEVSLSCPQWQWTFSYAKTTTLTTSVFIEDRIIDKAANDLLKVKAVKTPTPKADIPPSVSILLNFGLNGRKHMLFSSSDRDWMMLNDGKCSDSYIWDPFMQLCRKLSCTGNFNLVNFECVESEEHEAEGTSRGSSQLSEAVMGIETNAVVIYLNLKVHTVTLDDEEELIIAIENNLKHILASSVGISTGRITNVTVLKNDTGAADEPNLAEPTNLLKFNYTGGLATPITTSSPANYSEDNWNSSSLNRTEYKSSKGGSLFIPSCIHDEEQNDSHLVFHTRFVNVAFYLAEPESQENIEPSIDRVVSLITSNINLNTLFMVVADLSVQIRGIHEETFVKDTDQFQDWCLDGDIREYMSNEFVVVNNDVVTDDWHMQIHINRTGMDYHKGEFLANFIFQGTQGEGGLTNISGIVVVCENRSRILRDVTCPRLTLNESEYQFQHDKTVVLNPNRSRRLTYNWGEYELLPDNELCVCFKLPSSGMSNSANGFTFDIVQAYVNLVLMSVSLCATFATLVTYMSFSELRTVPGINLINFAVTVFVSQLTFILGLRGTVTGLACRLVAIFMHYVILASFFWSNAIAFDLYKTFGTSSVLPHSRDKFRFVLWYSLYAYMWPSVIVAIAVFLDSCSCVDGFTVGHGLHDVCWIGDPVATTIFFAAPLTILFIVNCVLYTITIISIRKVTKMTRLTCNHKGSNDVLLYIRMSSVMGFTWIFGLGSAFTGEGTTFTFCMKQMLTYLFIVLYASQGVMLFGAFTCNKRVSKLYRLRIQGLAEFIKNRHCSQCKKIHCRCQIQSISRSTSVETSRTAVN